MSRVIIVVALMVSTLTCHSSALQKEPVNSTTRTAPTPRPTPSPAANQKNSSQAPDEPSRQEIEKSVPKELLDEERCGIEENVAVLPLSGGAPLSVSFDASASTAPCGIIVKWEWDFGDGAKGKGRRVRHTYRAPGTYAATLKVADNAGHINLAELDYEIKVTAKRSPRPATRRAQGKARRKSSE